MRYITNTLAWHNDPLFDSSWRGFEGDALLTHFTFGGKHAFQAASYKADTFHVHPLSLEEAVVWMAKGPFQSLIRGQEGEEWSEVLEGLLKVPVPLCEPSDETETPLAMGEGDFVLRVGFSDPRQLWERPRLEDIKAHPQRVTWWLHSVGRNERRFR